MYSQLNIEDVDEMTPPVEGNDATIVPVGYILETDQLRPNLWRYDPGESTSLHRQDQQEELYYVLEGELVLEIGETPEDTEEVPVAAGDVLVVPPEPWRRLEARTEATVFAVGSPSVSDDHEIHVPE